MRDVPCKSWTQISVEARQKPRRPLASMRFSCYRVWPAGYWGEIRRDRLIRHTTLKSIEKHLDVDNKSSHSNSLEYLMMTSSNGNIFRVTGPLCGEFTGPGEFPAQKPVTRSFDVFFDLRPNKRLSKLPWGWWFETLSWSLWRHRNVLLT